MYRKEYTERKHVIDFLFPLALFFALAASSVALVVLASGSYSRQIHTSEDSYASCTALSYVTEKLHQADSSDAIVAGTFDGQDAILIRQEYSGQSDRLPSLSVQDRWNSPSRDSSKENPSVARISRPSPAEAATPSLINSSRRYPSYA